MSIINRVKNAWRGLSTPQTIDYDYSTMIKADAEVESASTSRRMRTWGTSTSGPNTLLTGNVATTRSRSHQSYRNNPIAISCVDSLVSSMVGRGITPRWKTGDRTLDADILRLWNISCTEMDHDNVLGMAGLQELVARTFILSGDAMAHYQYLKPTRDLLVPFQVKIMEGEQFYENYNGLLANGNALLMGVEFNKKNERVSYHLNKFHPGESDSRSLMGSTDVVKVNVQDMSHIFKPLRPGQCRGWPKLSGILTRLKAIDEYEDGLLDAQKTSAMFSAFITKPGGESVDPGVDGESVNYQEEDYLGLEPASITTLLPGEDIKFANPPELSAAYAPWIKNQLLRISAAFGITYEQLTNDLEGANLATVRASLLEFQRRCRMMQFNILIHMFCKPLATKWLDTAVLCGAISIPKYINNRKTITSTVWDPDGWEWVDPIKQANAYKILNRCGYISRSGVVSSMGNNSEVVDAEIASDNARADSAGVIYDSDPRYGKGANNTNMANPNKEEGK